MSQAHSQLQSSQPSLFGLPSHSDPVSGQIPARQKRIDAAFARQTDAFKRAFRAFARGFYQTQTGEAAKVIEAYKLTDLPKPVKDYRATGGIFQSMIHGGEIHSVGTVKAADGSGRLSAVYAKVVR